MLGGMLVWTAHFFGIYAVASILLDTLLSRALVLLLTLLCLAADAAIRLGTSAGASRLISGSMSIHADLESRLGDVLADLGVAADGLADCPDAAPADAPGSSA